MPEERSGFLYLHLFLDTVTMGLKLRGGTLTPCGRPRVLSPSPHPIPTSAKVFFSQSLFQSPQTSSKMVPYFPSALSYCIGALFSPPLILSLRAHLPACNKLL